MCLDFNVHGGIIVYFILYSTYFPFSFNHVLLLLISFNYLRLISSLFKEIFLFIFFFFTFYLDYYE